MTQNVKQFAAEQQETDRFFLPDLCASQSVFFLVLVSQLFAVVLTLAASGVGGFDWERLALTSLYVQWVGLSSALLLCKLRPYLKRLSSAKGALFSYLIIPLNAWIVSSVSLALMGIKGAGLFSDTVLTHVVIAAIIGGLVIRYFHLQAQLVARKQAALENRIQALQSRIQPHFLFNSMNSIASLIQVDPERAEEAVEDLSHLFRASLNDAGNQVLFAEEQALCERYLRIEQLRLGKRLRVTWAIKPLPAKLSIPLLTLQPLLENAIVHGIQPLPEGGLVEIEAQHQHGVFELKIVNPVPVGAASPTRSGNRIALDNIRHRLQALYGDRAKLTSYPDHQHYITRLTYPYEG